jgi:hypothetical protein
LGCELPVQALSEASTTGTRTVARSLRIMKAPKAVTEGSVIEQQNADEPVPQLWQMGTFTVS